MPDIHFHDVYADFEDGAFEGLHSEASGKKATIRTMAAQLASTRLFNENYFAFIAALDDAAKRGIKLIALPGDFSDDGQPVHIRGLVEILRRYEASHDMQFFAAPGNHDPTRPLTTAAGKADYLGEGGHPQRIFSRGARECEGYTDPWSLVKTEHPLATVCTEEVRELGYEPIMNLLADFGFYPKSTYHYWETPYSDYDTESYDVTLAKRESAFDKRQYEICHSGRCAQVPDSSYLVEPVSGLWLLAIDANVYLPTSVEGNDDKGLDGNDFKGAGNAGYNQMVIHKRHVIDWVEQVVERAEKNGKRLIAFSHYPMAEFYDGQSEGIQEKFGADAFQLVRRPEASVSAILAKTGLRVHVGGHMHINDTGVVRRPDGEFLFNVQAPSVAAYVPAYKVLTVKHNSTIDVQTRVLEEVPGFDELFEHYQREHKTLSKNNEGYVWNADILESETYREFTEWHLRELAMQRFLPEDWPESLRQVLGVLDGRQLMILSFMTERTDAEGEGGWGILKSPEDHQSWRDGQRQAAAFARTENVELAELAEWNGLDLAVDFYRFRNAGHLAFSDVNADRMAQYSLLEKRLGAIADGVPRSDESPASDEKGVAVSTYLAEQLYPVLQLLGGLQRGEPNVDFTLNTETGELTSH